MEQLLLDGYPITTKQFDKLNIDAPNDTYLTDKYDGWSRGVTATVCKWFSKRPTLAIPQDTRIEQEVVNIYTDGSKKNNTATQATIFEGKEVYCISNSTLGSQEINNAELQAALTGLTQLQHTSQVRIFSDSLNTVGQKGRLY